MCDCIRRTNERFKQKNMNTELVIACILTGETRILVATDKIDTKIRGKAVNMMATYCPFCGEKYPELTS